MRHEADYGGVFEEPVSILFAPLDVAFLIQYVFRAKVLISVVRGGGVG